MDNDDILFGIWLVIVGIALILNIALLIVNIISDNTNINEYKKCICYIVEENR